MVTWFTSTSSKWDLLETYKRMSQLHFVLGEKISALSPVASCFLKGQILRLDANRYQGNHGLIVYIKKILLSVHEIQGNFISVTKFCFLPEPAERHISSYTAHVLLHFVPNRERRRDGDERQRERAVNLCRFSRRESEDSNEEKIVWRVSSYTSAASLYKTCDENEYNLF